ncbi:MAG: hypothetical protein F4X03_09585 [Dehalococcoidia bacterium]|nr:hypothetical protein [Dehalococcoidia bacterium]
MKRMKPLIIAALVASFALSTVLGTSAQGPPDLPVIFEGTVSDLDGDVAAGLPVESYIGDGAVNCNNNPTETFERDGQTRYWVKVASSGQTAGCGVEGATVRFKIGDRWATQTGTWTGLRSTLNLTLAPEGPETVTISVAVWRRNVDPVGALAISTLAPGGTWQTSDWPLDMSDVSRSGRWNRSEITEVEVELAGGSTVTIDVAVWQRRVDPVGALAVSTLAPGGTWQTSDWPLDMSDRSRSGRWNRSEIVEVEVELE